MEQIKSELRQRVEELRQLLQRASLAYYVFDNPIIEDVVYDQLYRELQQLETQYPELVTPDSPTQRVGEKPSTQFLSVQHKIPLYSLENAFNIEELKTWQQRWQRVAPSGTQNLVGALRRRRCEVAGNADRVGRHAEARAGRPRRRPGARGGPGRGCARGLIPGTTTSRRRLGFVVRP